MRVPAGLTSGAQLFHTLRFLRPHQLAAQLIHRGRRLVHWPLPRAPALSRPDPVVKWRPRAAFLPGGGVRQERHALLQGRFRFLSREESVGWPPEWRQPGLARLWEYNLHYFEFLWALPYEEAKQVTKDWIANHPPGGQQVGWEPYPISLRLMNWCTIFFGRDRKALDSDPDFGRQLWSSLTHQAEVLRRNPEHHLLGNHLLENGLALSCCGACFEGSEAERWLAAGTRILASELGEQLLADGGHFERSPMYHARVVSVLTLLANTGVPEVEALVSEPLERARRALEAMVHPDGEIALLNDAAIGIVNAPSVLLVHAPKDGLFALPDTGYFGARQGGRYIICDAGPVGPDHLPGHAHGDIFSFELSLFGQRMVVDAGVYDYEVSELRDYCRSTRAHNTVEIDGADQCEFWGAFRVARRGRPREVKWEPEGQGFRLQGWHDGYQRLPGRPRHHRTFRWYPEGVLLVRDRVSAGRIVSCRTRLHLHPDCEIVEHDTSCVRIAHPAGRFSVAFSGPGRLELERSWYCPEFGVRLPNRALCFQSDGQQLETGFCIAPGHDLVGYDAGSGVEIDGRRFSL